MHWPELLAAAGWLLWLAGLLDRHELRCRCVELSACIERGAVRADAVQARLDAYAIGQAGCTAAVCPGREQGAAYVRAMAARRQAASGEQTS